MKNPNKTTPGRITPKSKGPDKATSELMEKYRAAADSLLDKAKSIDAKSGYEYAIKLNKELQLTQARLIEYNRKWTNKHIAKEMSEVEKDADDIKKFLLSHKIPDSPKKFAYHAFVELSEGTKKATERTRRIINNALSAIEIDHAPHIDEIKKIIAETMAEDGVLNIEYGSGAKMPLNSYATMAARTARIETENVENLKRVIEEGGDLVKCTTVEITCDICAKFQGRVYSVSGNDKRFPALYQTAFKHGYSIIHPNCRHEFMPFLEDLYSPKEIREFEEKSNKPFVDNRSERVREAYAKWQSQNRQYREEKKEYRELKVKLGDQMPYKTIGGFRRARRAESAEYKYHHYEKRDTRQYENWQISLGEMPVAVDEFREMKYNNPKEFAKLQDELKYEKAVREVVANAKEDGVKHNGKYKEAMKLPLNKVKKAYKSYANQVDEHEDKIKHPEKYDADWLIKTDEQKAGLLKKWQKDKKRNDELKRIIKEVINERNGT